MSKADILHLVITTNQEKLIDVIQERQISKFVLDSEMHQRFMVYGSDQYSECNAQKLQRYVRKHYEQLYCNLFYIGLFFFSSNKLVNVNLVIDIGDSVSTIVPVRVKEAADLLSLVKTFNINLQWVKPEKFNSMMQNLTDNPLDFADMFSMRFSYMLAMAGALAVREHKRINRWQMN